MRRYLVAAAVIALTLPAVAAAKGPVSATISGPGLERSLAIAGDGEGPGTALGSLAGATGPCMWCLGRTRSRAASSNTSTPMRSRSL